MKANKRERKKHRGIYMVLMAASVAYLGLAVFFMDRFFPGTMVNDMDCSWCTASEVEERLLAQAESVSLTLIERDGTSQVVAMEELGGTYEVGHRVKQMKRTQNGFLWPRMFFEKDCYEVEPEAVFEEKEFQSGLKALHCMQDQEAPQDAKILFTDTGYEVQKEVEGNTLNREILADAVRKAFVREEAQLELEAAGCYEEPVVRADSEEIRKVSDQLDVWLSASITYEIGEEPQVIDSGMLMEWIACSDGEVSLKEEEILAYVDALADRYDPETTKRVFYGTLQGRVVLTDKKHKWHIDREREKEALLACIKEGGTICREPYYLVPSGSHMGSEIGDTYVEVDMTAQHLWLYRDGKLIMDTDVVTGSVRRGTQTPGILAYVYAMQRNRTLRGEGYASFVKYWVPFYRGYGLHDANWRGSFGGDIYKTNGSHGCINIPPSVMPEVYENIELGMPVITYY